MTRPACRGFTLIELLVALAAMAVLALMSWRGIDGMLRAQEQVRRHGDDLLVLQTALAQWRTDLDAQLGIPQVQPWLQTPLDWNGQVLRIARASPDADDAGVQVVAWGRRDVQGQQVWLRWRSPVLHTRGQVLQAWEQAAVWGQNPGDELRRQEIALLPLGDWQLFYHRGGAWSHPLSSADAAEPRRDGGTSPDGVRLVLTLPAGGALAGPLTVDWMRPTLGGTRS